jgi:hypothetical protein
MKMMIVMQVLMMAIIISKIRFTMLTKKDIRKSSLREMKKMKTMMITHPRIKIAVLNQRQLLFQEKYLKITIHLVCQIIIKL